MSLYRQPTRPGDHADMFDVDVFALYPTNNLHRVIRAKRPDNRLDLHAGPDTARLIPYEYQGLGVFHPLRV